MTAAVAIHPEALTGHVLRDWDEATQVAQHAQFDTSGPTNAAVAYQD